MSNNTKIPTFKRPYSYKNTDHYNGRNIQHPPQHSLANDLRVLLDGGAILNGNIRLAHHGV